MKKITLSSNYNFTSGYGELLHLIISEFPNLNYDVVPRTYSIILPEYAKYFESNKVQSDCKLDLCLLSLVNSVNSENPLLHLNFNKSRILLTMWESTRINDLLIEILNKFNCIIVPNYYNKQNLINQGCVTRIEVLPLFCDTDHYIYKPHYDRSEFVFGISNEDPRKNINKVQACFLKTFKNNNDVKLCIKTCKRTYDQFVNSNIIYTSKKYSKDELKDWYHNLDIYVSGATCEGWGMMQQESMCCGRPVIYTNYGGLKEFINDDIGFKVKHKEIIAKDLWGAAGGKWSDFDENDMIEKMLYCYNHREEVIEKGKLASKEACKFTKKLFLKKLDNILKEYL